MEKLAKHAVDLACQLGADYADIRICYLEKQEIRMKNGKLEVLTEHQDQGFGLRVLAEGGWGFVSCPSLSEEAITKSAGEALQTARASAKVRQSALQLSDVAPVQSTTQSPVEKDPFVIPIEEKIDLLTKADQVMAKYPAIKSRVATFLAMREQKLFVSSIGSCIHQEMTIVGGGVRVVSSDGRDVQIRSYPNMFDGNFQQAGYEYVESLDLVQNAARIAEEATLLLEADPCPTGNFPLLLHGSQLALQIHESCGHAVELDRVLGEEAGFVGKSFLTTDQQHRFMYGSPLVQLTADATTAGGLGSFAFDDEGVPGQTKPIVENGTFVGYLTGRDTAPQIGEASMGAMRAVGWQNVPIVRMTNINLAPGDLSLEELITSTEYGIYMEGIRSWSIDDLRYQFHFGCEIAWEIRDGKKARMLKNPSYSGNTPDFWRSCDGIADLADWKMWGFLNCGKGEPIQVMYVGHGTSTARFQNVQVGVN
ncbi:TldD/PmbA family protein [Risungbinella massiliensis]|uniref:TldD/PmbA family protein n=1 Tax=Risungbinella massiliensis TaxID=1329796 RepID=UPI0005CC656F|nr:TldD/PmbA family protein [Risungbinella massiliensis]